MRSRSAGHSASRKEPRPQCPAPPPPRIASPPLPTGSSRRAAKARASHSPAPTSQELRGWLCHPGPCGRGARLARHRLEGDGVPSGPVIFAPILQSGRLDPGRDLGGRRQGARRHRARDRLPLGCDVAPGAAPAEVLGRRRRPPTWFSSCARGASEPGKLPRHVMLADCIANAGLIIGPEIAGLAQPGPEGAARPSPGRRHGARRGQERRPSRCPAVVASGLGGARQASCRRPDRHYGQPDRHELAHWPPHLEGIIDGCGDVSNRAGRGLSPDSTPPPACPRTRSEIIPEA